MEEEVQINTSSTIVEQVETKREEPLQVQEGNYKVKDLIDNCEALGYKKEVVAGAFYNCEKTEMTKSDFKQTIESFLGKKVE